MDLVLYAVGAVSFLVISVFGALLVWLLGDPFVVLAVKWRCFMAKQTPLIIKVNKTGLVTWITEKKTIIEFGKDMEGRPIQTQITGKRHFTSAGVPVHICVEGKAINVDLTKEYKATLEDKELNDMIGEAMIFGDARGELFRRQKKDIPWKLIALIAIIVGIGVLIYMAYMGMIPLPVPGGPANVNTTAITPAG